MSANKMPGETARKAIADKTGWSIESVNKFFTRHEYFAAEGVDAREIDGPNGTTVKTFANWPLFNALLAHGVGKPATSEVAAEGVDPFADISANVESVPSAEDLNAAVEKMTGHKIIPPPPEVDDGN
jgi:hypothetical protein